MPRLTLPTRIAGLLAGAALLLGLAGSAAGQSRISNLLYTPDPIPVAGCTLEVSCNVHDDIAVAAVVLSVRAPSGALVRSSNMSFVSTLAPGYGLWEGSINVDLNSSNSSDGESVYVTSTDTSGSDVVLVNTQRYSNTAPSISDIAYNPEPLPIAGGTISVSADVTDANLPLTSVTLETLSPTGTVVHSVEIPQVDAASYAGQITLDLNGSNGSDGESIVIVATDAAGNTRTSKVATQGYSKTPPSISSIVYSPDPLPIAGGTIGVSADVADVALPLASVTLETLDPSGTVVYSYGMNQSDAAMYTGQITLDLNGSNKANGESIYIVATDVDGNTRTSKVATQGYSDVIPSISDIVYSPDPLPVAGGMITVSADVTDARLPLASVTLETLNPAGTVVYTYGMNQSNGQWSAQISLDMNGSNTANGESIFIVATDAAGNTRTTKVATQGYSKTPPSISGIVYSPDPLPVAGGTVVVSADVTDSALPLASVTLETLSPTGTVVYTYGMNQSNGQWSAQIKLDPNSSNSANGESIFIVATDTAGNTRTTKVATQGYSKTPPTISSIAYSPDPLPVAGGTVVVSADVTDSALPLASVTLETLSPTGTVVYFYGMSQTNGVWSAQITLDLNGSNKANGESIYIVATDVDGNTRTSKVATQGYSDVKPTISHIAYSPAPLPVAGGLITVSADVTDTALPLTSVTLETLSPTGTVVYTYGMNQSNGVWSAQITLDLNAHLTSGGGESIVIVAVDAAGNTKTTTVATQGYSTAIPSITSIYWSPHDLPANGGPVVVSCYVTDATFPVVDVELVVTNSNGVVRTSGMGGFGDFYFGTITIDAEGGGLDENVTIVATDIAGRKRTAEVEGQ